MCKHKRDFAVIITLVVFFMLAVNVLAQEQEENTVEDGVLDESQEVIIDNQELMTFFEQYFQEKMAELSIPGLAFAFIDQDEISAAGYGYADIEHMILVDPAKTVFPMEDISKVITATAVLQLTESGALDLNADINHYLSTFKIKDIFPRPITAFDLLTHSSGLADDNIAIYAKQIKDIEPLDEYLLNNMPPRVLAPGKLSIYGDYGFGLLGYIVQEISGLAFSEYMNKHILEPLDMQRSSFNWTPSLPADYALGYTTSSDGLIPHPPAYPRNTPANSLSSSVLDMANYIMAHLNGGTFNGRQILTPAGLNQLQQLKFTQNAKLPGWTFGFYEHKHNNKRVILHGGDSSLGYSNIMFILPEENFGMMVSVNTFAPGFGLKLVNDFLDWRYPVKEAAPVTAKKDAEDRMRWFEGTYTVDYPARNSLSRLRKLFTQIHVIPDKSGFISIDFPPELDLPDKWVEVEPLLFRAVDSEDYLAFLDNEFGRITHLYAGGQYNFSKVAWYQTMEITVIAFCAFTVIFGFICLVWLIRKIRRRRIRSRLPDEYQQNMGALISLLNLIFIGGLVLYLRFYSHELIYEVSPVVYGLLVMPLISAALTLILFFTDSPFKKKRRSFIMKLYNFLVKAVNIAFFIYLWSWSLVGFW